MPGQRKGLTYEKAVAELEAIIQRLEDGEAGLEESLTLFESGIELLTFCESKLNEAQGKVEKILERADSLFRESLQTEDDAEDLESED